MLSRKRKIVITCIFVTAVCILIQTAVHTPRYLDWKIDHLRQEYVKLVTQGESEFQKLAGSIYEEAKNREDGLYRDEFQSNFPHDLNNVATQILENSSVKFDSIYVGGATQLIYPTGCCVFRYAVEDRQGVYAWVDLIYSPSCDDADWNGCGKPEEIEEDWYVVILYGF